MMTIHPIEVTVGEITQGYVNNDEQGVRGYGGRLDIRPPYQREFIYNEKEQQAVITRCSHLSLQVYKKRKVVITTTQSLINLKSNTMKNTMQK